MTQEQLVSDWQNHRDWFTEIGKGDFDALCRTGQFSDGPTVRDLTAWAKEFGPYSPHRWAFGELKDRRRVCAQVHKRRLGFEV